MTARDRKRGKLRLRTKRKNISRSVPREYIYLLNINANVNYDADVKYNTHFKHSMSITHQIS